MWTTEIVKLVRESQKQGLSSYLVKTERLNMTGVKGEKKNDGLKRNMVRCCTKTCKETVYVGKYN